MNARSERFTVRVPPSSVCSMRANECPPPVKTQRLLVVEDMEDARTSMQDLLRLTLKLEVDAAADGQLALKMLGERPYSVVLTDLRMPKLSGMQLIDEVQKQHAAKLGHPQIRQNHAIGPFTQHLQG